MFDVLQHRTRSVTREEKNLSNFLKLSADKWVENSFEVWCVVNDAVVVSFRRPCMCNASLIFGATTHKVY